MAMEIRWTADSADGLLSEYREYLIKIQDDALDKIAQAEASGDLERKRKLRGSLRENLEALGQAYEERLKKHGIDPQAETALFDRTLTRVNLDEIVYDGDRDYQLEFRAEPHLAAAYERFQENNPTFSTRRELLKTALKLSPSLAPELYAVLNRCRDALGLTREIEIYVYQDTDFNASCYPPDSSRLYIMLTSSLLEKFDDDELAFVLGHEIGHAILNHHDFPVEPVMELGGNYLSPLHRMKLYAWKRAAEVSADRTGLLCCQNFEAAVRAFFKLSSGVTTNNVRFKLQEYVNQFADLEAEISATDVNPQDWFRTHPFSPMRIKALESFVRSETYHRLIGKEGGDISEEKLEGDVLRFMRLMDPVYLREGASEETKTLAHRYLMRAGYMVAAMDGEVEEEEVNALGRMVPKEIFSEFLIELEAQPEESRMEWLGNQIGACESQMNTLFSHMDKLGLVRNVILISVADGEIEEPEVAVLRTMCEHLGIEVGFVDHVLQEATQGEPD